jgi:FMN phosphatase YigB (HAD superfamily)
MVAFDERTWLFFNGDNTLWDVEILYDQQRAHFCEYMEHLFQIPRDKTDAVQRKTDSELYRYLVYSPRRFPTSFVETLKKLAPEHIDKQDTIDLVYAIGAEVFRQAAPVEDHVGSILRAASRKYNLAMITSGDTKVQLKRLSDFEHSELFGEICVIPRKDDSTFLQFAERVGAEPALTAVIGDSLRSDINAADRAGFKTYWLVANNWDIVEIQGHSIPQGTTVIHSLMDLIEPLGLDLQSGIAQKQVPNAQHIQLPEAEVLDTPSKDQ